MDIEANHPKGRRLYLSSVEGTIGSVRVGLGLGERALQAGRIVQGLSGIVARRR
jgi:hypothetical protein